MIYDVMYDRICFDDSNKMCDQGGSWFLVITTSEWAWFIYIYWWLLSNKFYTLDL